MGTLYTCCQLSLHALNYFTASVNGVKYTLAVFLRSTPFLPLPHLPFAFTFCHHFLPSPSALTSFLSPLSSPLSSPSFPDARSAPEVCYGYNTVGNCYGKCSIEQPCGSVCRQIPCAQEYVLIIILYLVLESTCNAVSLSVCVYYALQSLLTSTGPSFSDGCVMEFPFPYAQTQSMVLVTCFVTWPCEKGCILHLCCITSALYLAFSRDVLCGIIRCVTDKVFPVISTPPGTTFATLTCPRGGVTTQ